ncbi:hypothetical protein H0H93_001495 [Arthromyces matolae]|nr:hypothetical protein H0H93_001495 [Arthromyces matolae]
MSEVACYEDRLVKDHKVQFCSELLELRGVEGLIVECPNCNMFYGACCFHRDRVCHNSRIVMTDGACSSNGQKDAKSGVGIVLGRTEDFYSSLPVDDEMDGDASRTSQRAELLAAIIGLSVLHEVYKSTDERDRAVKGTPGHPQVEPEKLIANGLRNLQGKRPANIDLFLKLDQKVKAIEATGLLVGLWNIPKKHNTLANNLARKATGKDIIDLD